jgi:hypothetical protein
MWKAAEGWELHGKAAPLAVQASAVRRRAAAMGQASHRRAAATVPQAAVMQVRMASVAVAPTRHDQAGGKG